MLHTCTREGHALKRLGSPRSPRTKHGMGSATDTAMLRHAPRYYYVVNKRAGSNMNGWFDPFGAPRNMSEPRAIGRCLFTLQQRAMKSPDCVTPVAICEGAGFGVVPCYYRFTLSVGITLPTAEPSSI